MVSHAETIRLRLARGPLTARQIVENMDISQPTLSRALSALRAEVVRLGAGPAIQYALRDLRRGLPDIPVYRVDGAGRLGVVGTLVPVRPEGFVMLEAEGRSRYSDGLPWWLLDMRPQGYLGRAYAVRHGGELDLPGSLLQWSDTDALRALLAHGHDMVGNLLLGEVARGRYLDAVPLLPVQEADKAATFARMADEAASGEVPGSSAGGEQPKFTAYAVGAGVARHVIVKFSEPGGGAVSERWRDILLAEHLALETLRQAGIDAAASRVLDHGERRFLEVERFDRVGERGRRALFSLAALDAEFVGQVGADWPVIAQQLADTRCITPEAAQGAELLWAFGVLMGNTDMHHGNLSFIADHGKPYALAPAYDMAPMAFAPRSGGGLPGMLADAPLRACVRAEYWRRAEGLARAFLHRVQQDTRFSAGFSPCITALERHLSSMGSKIARLA